MGCCWRDSVWSFLKTHSLPWHRRRWVQMGLKAQAGTIPGPIDESESRPFGGRAYCS